MILRLFLPLLFFASILFFPWWLSVFLALVLSIPHDAYEVLLGGVLMDALYGAPVPALFDLPIIFTLLFAAFFFAGAYLRPRLRIRDKSV